MEEKIRGWNKLLVDGIMNSLRRAITRDEARDALGEEFVETAMMYYGSWSHALRSANLFLSPQKLLEEILEMDPGLAEEVSKRAQELEKDIHYLDRAGRIAALAAACREQLFIRSQREAEKFLWEALGYWEADLRKQHKELKRAQKIYQHLLERIRLPPFHDQVSLFIHQLADKLYMSPEDVERALEYASAMSLRSIRQALKKVDSPVDFVAACIYLADGRYSLPTIASLAGASEQVARKWVEMLRKKLRISSAKEKLRKYIGIVERLPQWGLIFIKRVVHQGKIPFHLHRHSPYLWVECYIPTIYPIKWIRKTLDLRDLRARSIDLEPLQELTEVEEGKEVIIGIRPICPSAVEPISDIVFIEALRSSSQTAEEIASAVGCPRKSAEYRLERLVWEGIVRKEITEKGTPSYSLAEEL